MKGLLTSMLFVAVLLAVVSTSALGQVAGTVESQNLVKDSKVDPTVDIYVHGPLGGKFEWSVWSLTCKGWAEAYVGPVWKAAEWLELSGSIGIETDKNPLRYAGSIWMGSGRFSFISFQEGGGSGWWHKEVGTLRIVKSFKAGVHSQRFVGTGPYAEVTVNKFTVWTSVPVQKSDGAGVYIGLKFAFGGK